MCLAEEYTASSFERVSIQHFACEVLLNQKVDHQQATLPAGLLASSEPSSSSCPSSLRLPHAMEMGRFYQY